MNIEQIYREESARILATLIRLLDDFDLAEKVKQQAFAAAFEPWPAQGIPRSPRAWLLPRARNKAVDRLGGARGERKEEQLQRLATVQE